MLVSPKLLSDPLEIKGFVRLILKNARFGFVQLRCFRQGDQAPVLYPWQAVKVTETETLIAKAIGVATRAANHIPAAMFAPPVVTLDNPKTAQVANIAEGLCIRVECDANAVEATQTLRGILGTPTLIVCSGGVWIAPDGHTEDKRHLYWRLATPTRSPEQHDRLREACRLACLIVGADASAIPAVHPLRWPGSWHRKAEPRMAVIDEIEDVEIDLDDALVKLKAAADERGLDPPTPPPAKSNIDTPPEYDEIAAAVAAIPNNLNYAEWVLFGFEVYTATNGSGFDLFDQFTRAWPRYSYADTLKHWRSFRVGSRGVGSLFMRADQADPDWRRRYREAKTNVMTEEYRKSIIETYEMIKQPHKGAHDQYDTTTNRISI